MVGVHSNGLGGEKVNGRFVESVFTTWLRMTVVLLTIFRITASPWWTPTSVCALSRPGPVTAIPSTSLGSPFKAFKFSVAVPALMDPEICVGLVGAPGVLSFQCIR